MLISNLASDLAFLNWFLWQQGNNAFKALYLSHHGILQILMQAVIDWSEIDSKEPMSAGMPFNLRKNTHEYFCKQK